MIIDKDQIDDGRNFSPSRQTENFIIHETDDSGTGQLAVFHFYSSINFCCDTLYLTK